MLSRKYHAASTLAEVAFVLAAHQLWLETDGREGKRAELYGADVRECLDEGADLRDATLRRCNLSGLSLKGANLERADLSGADLRGVNFTGANMKEARLFNADLEGADLRGAKVLKSAQLCGCDLSYAELPPHIKFYGLEQANQSLGRLAVQFVSMLTLCVYSWLIIGSTTDADLLTNASSVSVPFIDLSLPILGFYLLVPFALVALSTAFYVHLQTFWDKIATLPAYFPDGSEVTAHTPPTLLDRLVERHMTHLRRKKSTPVSRLYASLITLGLFGLVPATIFAFWLRFLTRHDAFGTMLQLALLLAYLAYTWLLAVSMKAKLGLQPVGRLVKHAWRQLVLAIAFAATLAYVSVHVLYGPHVGSNLFYANLVGQRLSAKGGEPDSGNAANLAGMNLRHVNLAGAFAQNADFSRSVLEDATLNRANLRNTSLRGANLTRAGLNRVQLQSADLRRAVLRGAMLSDADLRSANLTQADLRRTTLTGATVARANFSRANLLENVNAHGITGESVEFTLAQMSGAQLSRAQLAKSNFFLADLRDAFLWRAALPGASFILADLAGANFTQANLTGADLSQASARGAVFDRARLGGAKLVCAQLYEALLTEADLTGADLQSAQLRGATLRGARLVRAQFGDASLEDADLRGADLSEAVGLSRGQLVEAVLDDTTIFPSAFEPLKAAILAESAAAHRQ